MKRQLPALLLLAAAIVGAATLCGCSDSDNPIKKPIAEHILGKWEQVETYTKIDGEWVKDKSPEGFAENDHYRFLPGGKLIRSIEDIKRSMVYLMNNEWSVNESNHTMTVNEYEYTILRLTDEEWEFSYEPSIDKETGEVVEQEGKAIYRRIDESKKCLVEKMVGKWKLSKRYVRKDGEWVEDTQDLPDECWREYTEEGTSIHYSRMGSEEKKTDYKAWYIFLYARTGGIFGLGTDMIYHLQEDKQLITFDGFQMDDDNTFSITYSNSFDFDEEGLKENGGSKEVFVRE